jgi:ubiquinone/menaquinone biosynthesis C-methylase UbiE
LTIQKKKDIQKKYDELNGRIYDLRYKEEQHVKYSEILKHIHMESRMIILDHGCGTGFLLEFIKYPVIGVDISSKLLETAKERTKKLQEKYLIQADVDKLPFKYGSIDIAFSITVLQNLPDPIVSLKELKNILKPNSNIVISTHRKTLTENAVKKYINEAHFKIQRVIDKNNIQDIIIIANND